MIQVDRLTKYYGGDAAIRNLAFNIQKGEVIGFLGLNGAGKTTTLKILGCVLLPTAGRVSIDGYDVVRSPHEIRRKIGFLPDVPPVYGEMTVGDYLAFVARLRKVSASDAPARVREVEAQTGLDEVHDKPIGQLSHGYRQRVGVAQALVHKPSLLILDEPTGGLDPVQTVEMRELIRRLRGEQTVLISSHILSEISQICDRLLVIQAGEIVAQGTEEELARKFGGAGAIDVEVRGAPERAVEILKAVPGVSDVSAAARADGVAAVKVFAPADLRPELVRALVRANLDVLRVDRSVEKLESIFLKLTHGQKELRS
ncbi:MAG TPA: ABC transporter ATP-binding protein [Myxococcaceae bacterium]|nr:ABC transporter ATP-binding protein [Myxococcaceae bacterium]